MTPLKTCLRLTLVPLFGLMVLFRTESASKAAEMDLLSMANGLDSHSPNELKGTATDGLSRPGLLDEEAAAREKLESLKQEATRLAQERRIVDSQMVEAQNILDSFEAKRRAKAGLQMDLMVPASGIDERLKRFSERLGQAFADYHKSTARIPQAQANTTISTFRLLVTRFTQEEKDQSERFRNQLANLTGLSLEHMVMVHSPAAQSFSRAGAMNLLHEAACHLETCLVARIDVDMQIKKEFFHNSVETVILQQNISPPPKNLTLKGSVSSEHWKNSWKNATNSTPTAYFPIVWSAYNPKSVQLVQKRLKTTRLSEYSEHSGHWRNSGTGMYALKGSDAAFLRFDTAFEGWGGEDSEFYRRVAGIRRIVRRKETGLIHIWHDKICEVGTEGMNTAMLRRCQYARNGEEGSKLGKQLLLAAKKGQQGGKRVVKKAVPVQSKRKRQVGQRVVKKAVQVGQEFHNDGDASDDDDNISSVKTLES